MELKDRHERKKIFHRGVTSNRAQTASELAIFGAILMFVVGVIVRTAMSSNQVMNQQLKVMRMAMTASYMSTMALGQGGNTSRNVGNVLIVEDRLSIDPNSRLGTRDRIPLINSSTAVLSNQLFQPIDWGETDNLAVFDVFINGQQFPFTTAGFKQIFLNSSHPNWDPHCYLIPGNPGPPPVPDSYGGCVRAYKIVGNYQGSPHWCKTDAACPATDKNLPVAERFDLDVAMGKNTPTNINPGYGTTDVPVAIPGDPDFRSHFSWQWYLTPAISGNSLAMERLQNNWGAGPGVLTGLTEFKKGDVYDVDGDGKEEIVHDFNCNGVEKSGVGANGVITCVRVADSQSGDVDFTINDRDKAKGVKMPGLQDDMQMFSFTKGFAGGPVGNESGTYLRVEEGKLFYIDSGDTRRFVRNSNRQNHVDIIQRIFRVSNNTGRFCNGNTPTATVSGVPNPVEACNDCFAQQGGVDHVTKTCMDTTQKLIFIRSRIADLRGRRWVIRDLK